MTPRSKKLLGSGDQEYFNEKRPVNGRVDGTAHLAELLPAPGVLRNTQPSPWFCPSVAKPEVIVRLGLLDNFRKPVIRLQ